MKRGLIICAFPATGKTYLSNARIGYVDLCSIPFNNLENYITVAEYIAGEGKNVLLDCSINIRQLLNKKNIPFVTVLPFPEDKKIYLERYLSKGEYNKSVLDKEYDKLCMKTEYDTSVYRIQKKQYLNDIIGRIRFEEQRRGENGNEKI